MRHVLCLALSSVRRPGIHSVSNPGSVIIFLLLTVLSQGCGGGGTGKSLPPPSGLAYNQPVITTTMQQAMTPDVPIVTGIVESYSVAPALPAGLNLNTSSGIVSGTPTSVSARASYMVTALNASGSTTTTLQITVNLPASPTDLSYNQTAIDAAIGQVIAPDLPTVEGTVDSYAVAPALPAGLSLNSSTGIISGTPTALAPLASYTVTASNAAGSVSAAILISVTPPLPAPTAIAYPQQTITTYVGEEITPDIPGTAGTVTRFGVSPALPAGLSMDPSTGIISGTPTAETPQAVYTVTGYNSGGSISAAVSPTITVTKTPSILLQLGNPFLMTTLGFASSRVLSQDYSGFWILWNYESGALLSSGDAGLGSSSVAGFTLSSGSATMSSQAATLAGGTIAIGIPGGIQVRSSSDGHVLSTIVSPGFHSDQNGALSEGDSWQLASDGSYIAVEGESGLFVYTPEGQLLFSRPGDYRHSLNTNLHPSFFAAPGQVQVADGPAGDSNIEIVSVPGGISTLSAPYDGQSQFFQSWFADGAGFFTSTDVVPIAVFVYSTAGVELGGVPGGASNHFGGAAKWVWTLGANQLTIYPAGSAIPALTLSGVYRDFTSGTILAAAVGASSRLSLIDLSGTTLTETDYTLPPPINGAGSPILTPFAAATISNWVIGFNSQGTILDGASLSSGGPRFLGNGLALGIAGGAGRTAIATGIGKIFYFDPADAISQGSVDLTSGNVQLSSDGNLLAASAQDGSLLNIDSLPSGSLSNTFTYSPSQPLVNFTLSASGTMIAQQVQNATPQIAPISGSPITFLGTGAGSGSPVLVSPDGTLAALTTFVQIGVYEQGTVTIYENGQPTTTISGIAVGWIDNSRLLVNSYALVPPTMMHLSYTGCTIYSPAGTVLGTPPLPELKAIQPVTSDTVYAPDSNAIYSITSGQATWTNPYSVGSGGAIAGPYIVFESEGRVIAIKH